MAISANQIALLDALLSFAGQGLTASGNAQANNNAVQGNLATNYAGNLVGLSGQRNDIYNNQQNTITGDANRRLTGAAGAGQMIGGPMDLAKSRAQFANQRAFLFGNGGNPQYARPADPAVAATMGSLPTFRGNQRFYTDQAMAASELPYHQAISMLTGGKIGGDALANSPYKGVGNLSNTLQTSAAADKQQLVDDQNKRTSIDANALAGIDRTQAAVNQALQQNSQQKKSSGFMSFLGKALPFAALAIPFIGPIASALGAGGTAAAAGGLNLAGGLAGGRAAGSQGPPLAPAGGQNVPGAAYGMPAPTAPWWSPNYMTSQRR